MDYEDITIEDATIKLTISEPMIEIDMDQFHRIILEARSDGIHLIVPDKDYVIKSGTVIVPKSKKGEQKRPPINGIGDKL